MSDQNTPIFAQPWVCRGCGAAQDEPDTGLHMHPGGYGYRAPRCGPCGQYFSADDIARFDVAPAPRDPRPAGSGGRA